MSIYIYLHLHSYIEMYYRHLQTFNIYLYIYLYIHSYLALFCPVLSHLILSHPKPPMEWESVDLSMYLSMYQSLDLSIYLILSYLILFCRILSYIISSYLILSYFTLSDLSNLSILSIYRFYPILTCRISSDLIFLPYLVFSNPI